MLRWKYLSRHLFSIDASLKCLREPSLTADQAWQYESRFSNARPFWCPRPAKTQYGSAYLSFLAPPGAQEVTLSVRLWILHSIFTQSSCSLSSVSNQSLISLSSVSNQSLVSLLSVSHQSLISLSSVSQQSLISLSSVFHQSLISISIVTVDSRLKTQEAKKYWWQ